MDTADTSLPHAVLDTSTSNVFTTRMLIPLQILFHKVQNSQRISFLYYKEEFKFMLCAFSSSSFSLFPIAMLID